MAKMAVLEKVMAKITKFLIMVISIFIGVSNCSEGSIFLPVKCGFAKGASFYSKTVISSVNFKLPVVFIYLNKTYDHIFNTTVDACFNSDPFLG